MTGFAFPEMMVQVCQAHAKGERDRAFDLFDAYLPFARYEQQAGLVWPSENTCLPNAGRLPARRFADPVRHSRLKTSPTLITCLSVNSDDSASWLNEEIDHDRITCK